MSRVITIHPETPVQRDGLIEWHAQLETQPAERLDLWFRTDAANAEHLSLSADAFVLATLFHTMRRGARLRVRGPVCPTLIRNVHEYQQAWARWYPNRYQIVEIEADGTPPPSPVGKGCGALTAFSGGLDSCFTVWRHTRSAAPAVRLPLDTALMVHGLDIPIWDTEVFARAAEKSRRILASVDVPLQTLATNLRVLDDDWGDSHGAGVAACLHAMGRQRTMGIIPGTHAYDALRLPCGSNPVTDPLLSSSQLAIVYEGAGFTRVDKAAAIADWPEAMQNVRVCWSGEHLDRNCGACPKCVALGICFAVNEKPIPESMPIPDLAAAIRAVMQYPLEPAGVQRMDERLALVKERGIQAPWVAAAEEWRRRSIRSWQPASRCRRLLSALRARSFF